MKLLCIVENVCEDGSEVVMVMMVLKVVKIENQVNFAESSFIYTIFSIMFTPMLLRKKLHK